MISSASRIVVVSPNQGLQSALQRLLAREATLSYQTALAAASDALDFFKTGEADIVISDSPPADVADVLAWRKVRELGPRLLMLTSYMREATIVRSIVAGASGIVLSTEGGGRQLLDILRQMSEGKSFIPQGTVARLQSITCGESLEQPGETERAVLSLILEGKSDSEVAAVLKMSPDAVRNAITDVVQQLT